jgi:hypothetical protein
MVDSSRLQDEKAQRRNRNRNAAITNSSLLKPEYGQRRSHNMAFVRMSKLSAVLLLTLLSLPAAAQQGGNDYPSVIPRDWTLFPPKNNEWRAVSPRQDAWLSLYITPAEGSVAPPSSSVRSRPRRSSDLPAARAIIDCSFWIHRRESYFLSQDDVGVRRPKMAQP